MSFYSYKNANADSSPGNVCGNILNGLNKKVCIQVKNVYDACLQQEQLNEKQVVIRNIVPVLPSNCQNTRGACGCTPCCEGRKIRPSSLKAGSTEQSASTVDRR